MKLGVLFAIAACGPPAKPVAPIVPVTDADPDGPHRDAIVAQVQPYIDAEIATGIVVAVYDAGRKEIYGFGKGPDGKAPDGKTLFELGAVTKAYTGLILADAIQRREVQLDTPVTDLVPPGVTVPTLEKRPITLQELVIHTSGLPRVPPSLAARPATGDPYSNYGEDQLYSDLIHTTLEHAPGEIVLYSNYGSGLLGFVLGRKIGGGYGGALATRIVQPLGLTSTFVKTPPELQPRRVEGSTDDLKAAIPWTWDALAGAGAVISDARDQLVVLDAEIDAGLGSKGALRPPMKFSQEAQLDHVGDNEGLGWMIDAGGRYWANGSTGGCHAFVGFDPKTKHGVVILASTATSLVDHLADTLYKILDGSPPDPPKFATPAQLVPYAGNYDLGGSKLQITVEGKRLYVVGPGEPPHRLVPISDHEFWSEALQTVAVFERDGERVARLVFAVGDHQIAATRIDAN